MNIQKKKAETSKVSIRLPKQLHEELRTAAEANDWSVNSEINHRLRMVTSSAKLETLIKEIAELKSLLRQSNS
jgi:transcriptional/translational regulatory protein YebC/TACO1